MGGLEFGSAGALVGWSFQIECTTICAGSRLGKTEVGRCPDLSPHDAHTQAAMVIGVVNRLEFGPCLALWAKYHGGDAHITAAAELVSAVFDRDVPRAALRECVRYWIDDDGAATTAMIGELAGVSQSTGSRIRRRVMLTLDSLRRQGLDVIEARFSELLTGNGVDQYRGGR